MDLFIEDLKEEIEKRTEIEEHLRSANLKLDRLARLDPLTRLANKRHFSEVLSKEWQRQRRSDGQLSIIICDVDYFKNYNDMYGHQQGDICLCKIAEILQEHARRPMDCVARFGGEEFVLLLPETAAADSFRIAEDIRKDLESLEIPHEDSEHSNVVTISLGVAEGNPSKILDPDRLILCADRALYRAKKFGRNRTILYTE